MTYFNYHAKAKKLILEGKLLSFEIVDEYNKISPALLLYFNDPVHPVMPIRKERWEEYFKIIEKKKTPPV